MRGFASILSLVLATMLSIAGSLNVLYVHCSNGQEHQAIERIGHRLGHHLQHRSGESHQHNNHGHCVHQHGHAGDLPTGSWSDHQHHDCDDANLVDQMVPARDVDAEDLTDHHPMATLPQQDAWSRPTYRLEPAMGRCGRPPPGHPGAITQFLTLRLLI